MSDQELPPFVRSVPRNPINITIHKDTPVRSEDLIVALGDAARALEGFGAEAALQAERAGCAEAVKSAAERLIALIDAHTPTPRPESVSELVYPPFRPAEIYRDAITAFEQGISPDGNTAKVVLSASSEPADPRSIPSRASFGGGGGLTQTPPDGPGGAVK